MKKFSDLFRKKVSETEKCEYQPSEEEKDYVKKCIHLALYLLQKNK